MPRYFFHVHGERDVQNDEGVELADLRTAQTEATKVASALLTQHAAELWNGHGWSIDVTNADSIVLCTLHFIAIVGSPLRPEAHHDLTLGG